MCDRITTDHRRSSILCQSQVVVGDLHEGGEVVVDPLVLGVGVASGEGLQFENLRICDFESSISPGATTLCSRQGSWKQSTQRPRCGRWPRRPCWSSSWGQEPGRRWSAGPLPRTPPERSHQSNFKLQNKMFTPGFQQRLRQTDGRRQLSQQREGCFCWTVQSFLSFEIHNLPIRLTSCEWGFSAKLRCISEIFISWISQL